MSVYEAESRKFKSCLGFGPNDDLKSIKTVSAANSVQSFLKSEGFLILPSSFQHLWCNGNISSFHVEASGSIPLRCFRGIYSSGEKKVKQLSPYKRNALTKATRGTRSVSS